MTEPTIVLQQVIYERTEPPQGFRIWSDGNMEHCAKDNPLPGETERLDRDRPVKWETERQLSAEQVEAVHTSIRESGFLTLPTSLTINYCKEDPGAAMWLANVDADSDPVRVVLWDPRPRRSPEIDKLLESLKAILG